jgi:hypothetical protein
VRKFNKHPGTTIKSLLGFHRNRELDELISRELLGWSGIRSTTAGLVGRPPRGRRSRQLLAFSDDEVIVGDLIESMREWDSGLTIVVVREVVSRAYEATWNYVTPGGNHKSISNKDADKIAAILNATVAMFRYLRRLNRSDSKKWLRSPREM